MIEKHAIATVVKINALLLMSINRAFALWNQYWPCRPKNKNEEMLPCVILS
jgi:hypothetical protein